MSEQGQSMSEIAAELARFLVTKNYTRRSPLDDIIEARITKMAREIADEVVDATPGIREIIATHSREVVQRALRDDAWLSKTVTDAVARALHQAAMEDG